MSSANGPIGEGYRLPTPYDFNKVIEVMVGEKRWENRVLRGVTDLPTRYVTSNPHKQGEGWCQIWLDARIKDDNTGNS